MLIEVKLSEGTAFLNKLTLKKQNMITRKMFEGTEPISQGEEIKMSPSKMIESSEYAFELLLNKIVIEEKEYSYNDIEQLEENDKLTREDIIILQNAISDLQNVSKKN